MVRQNSDLRHIKRRKDGGASAVCTLAFAAFMALPAAGAAAGPDQPTRFSAGKPGSELPPGWTLTKVKGIPRPTRFDLVKDGEDLVLRAAAEAAAASVSYKLYVDPAKWPRLSWRWKATRVVQKGDLATKNGDDYAARVYVFFDYDVARLPFLERTKIGLARSLFGTDVPAATLCYVWDNRYPAGTSTWSAYTDRVRMIVLESGAGKLGLWLTESRDVAADFRTAFGEAPPAVSGISLAADTDNTGESVVSYFGDVEFETEDARR